MESAGRRRTSGKEEWGGEWRALGRTGLCRFRFDGGGAIIDQDRQLPAVSRVMGGILLARGDSLQRWQRTGNRILCLGSLAAIRAWGQHHAMRGAERRTRCAVRSRQSERREQEPEKDSQLTQAELLFVAL